MILFAFMVTYALFWNTVAIKSSNSVLNQNELITVRTEAGEIVGTHEDGLHVFRGIPFAEPPIGILRFKPPQPRKSFLYPYLATNYSSECLQSSLHSEEDGSRRSEDCLYLNIWSPNIRGHTKNRVKSFYPVLVWIYGGAFMHGAATKPTYIGDQLARRDVIIVSLNYRMGALGFLVSTNDGLFGNYGLADQKLALLWIHNNIQYFGGDATKVTLFGESAGAMSIGLHYLDQQHSREISYTKTSPLFHAIVMQSNPLGYKYRAMDVANFIGNSYKQLLDCEDLLCLLSESADELLHVQDTLMASPRSIGDFFTWGPVITDAHWHRERRLHPNAVVSNFTVMQPIEAIKLVTRSEIPVIIGTNKDEGHVFVYSAFGFRMNKITYLLLMLLFFRGAAPAVLRTYNELSRKSEHDYRIILSTIINDYLFRCPNALYAHQLTMAGSHVYLYSFCLATRTPGFSCCDGKSCHTAELPYVFDHTDIIEKDYSWQYGFNPDFMENRNPIDQKVSKLMADYWTHFAKFKDPNGIPSMNGYTPDTRISNAPSWPRLLGDRFAINGVRDIDSSRRGSSAIVLNNGEATAVAKLKSSKIVGVGLFGSIKSSNPLVRLKGSKFVHVMSFGEVVEMNVVERDCVCEFWNRLQYRF